jgi:hypothetical protein
LHAGIEPTGEKNFLHTKHEIIKYRMKNMPQSTTTTLPQYIAIYMQTILIETELQDSTLLIPVYFHER